VSDFRVGLEKRSKKRKDEFK